MSTSIQDKMKTFIQVMLIVWFFAVTLFILVPSYNVLSGVGAPGAADLPQMPSPPEQPPASDLKPTAPAAAAKPLEQTRGKVAGDAAALTTEVRDPRVDLYTQRVLAYTQQVNAYKSQIESGKTRQVAAYRAVVTDTLVSLLSTALTALLGYVFVKAGAGLVNKYVAMKQNKQETDLEMF